MKILVLIKGVADLDQNLQVDAQGNFVNQTIETALNPYDKHAIEAALQLAGEEDTIEVLSFGDQKIAEKALREAISLGVQQATLVQSDLLVNAANTGNGIGVILAEAIHQIGEFQLILTGNEAADTNQGYTGAMVAETLGMDYVDYVDRLTINDGQLQYEALWEDGHVKDSLGTPTVVAVTDTINKPRLPSFKNKMASKKATIANIKVDAITLIDSEDFENLVTQVTTSQLMPVPVKEKQTVIYKLAETEDAVKQLLTQLHQTGILS